MAEVINTKKNKFKSAEIESESIESLSEKLFKANTELELKNRALIKAEKDKKEMLANISHDLRAPITAIRGALDLMNSCMGNPDSQEDVVSALGLIDRRVKTLESLIQDMYYLFCVEDEGRSLELEEIEAGPFLENYFFDAIVDSRYDSHEMEMDVPIDLNCKILIDVQKTVRVLDNLFTNAAKYSGSGTTIKLAAYKDESIDPAHLVILVKDNGVGIPTEMVNKIFERTVTASVSRTPGQETGSGLGLSIVKAVVEREHGTVKCRSEEGKGSEFVIVLPII